MNGGTQQGNHSVVCIVLNWNGGREIMRCLKSLQESAAVSPEVMVVDNGSTDGSVDLIEQQFPSIRIIRHTDNVGLVRARNEAVRLAMEKDVKYVFLIDDDAFVSPQCFRILLSVADASSTTGIVTPRILGAGSKDVIWFDGGLVNVFGDTFHRNMGGHISPEGTQVVEEPFEAEFATGCGMLVKKEVFETVGFFDEDYFVYCEDADFSFRARSAGFRIVHVPSALTWHHQSMDTKRNQGKWYRDYYVTRNKLLLVSKQTKGFRWLLFLGYFAVNQVFVPTLYYVLTAQFRRSAAIVLAVSDFISRRFGKRYA